MSTAYHSLASGSLTQNWTNAALIGSSDDWTGVPSVTGYLGDIDAASPTGVDPRTRTAADLGAVDVIANQTNPNTLTSGGVAEFAITDPTVALQGSGTADAPSLVFYLDSLGREAVRVQFNLRDIDGSADDAAQQVAVQFRTGGAGAWTNVSGGYVADATTGGSATQVTAVDVVLPEEANNQAQLEVRVVTTNAAGSDEWVGVDDIVISSDAGSGGADTTAPLLNASTPADNAVNVAADADIVLSFNETVQAGTGDITVTDGSGDVRVITLGTTDVDGSVSVNGSTVTIDLAADLAAGTTYDVVIPAGAIEDAAGNDFTGLAADALDFTTASALPTAIYTIQGSGHTSSLVGQFVTTTGVVTAVDSNGFYLQDAAGDGNAATSDGIFVFTSSAPGVSAGDAASVSGVVGEFVPNGAARGFLSVTQIDARGAVGGAVTDLGAGAAVAPTVIGGPGGLLPPTQDIVAGALFYESLEGMLVTVANPIAVGPTNNFGEIFTVVDADNDPSNGVNATGLTPRGTILIEGGASDLGDTNTVGGDFNPERIQIDDDSGVLAGFVTPDVDAGARLSNVTGVVSYNFGNYEVIATQAYTVVQESTLEKETTALTGSEDRLTVASYNAENLDPNDGVGRFNVIAGEIINNLKAPDIITLQEIQDNDGATNSAVTSASVTLQMMVDAISTAGGPQYAFIDNPFIGDDKNGGEPGGNIRTAYLYRTDRVDFVEGSLRTIGADGSAISDPAGNAAQQTDATNPFFGSRPPLVATFEFNGQDVTIVNNHWSSKGGSGALFGSEQPPFDGSEVQRAAQAQAVNNFVDGLLAQDAKAKVIVAGDLNEFPFEEPISVVKGTGSLSDYTVPGGSGGDPFNATGTFTPGGAQVLNDLLELLPENEQYDYVFEGNAQTLDHMLVTGGLQEGAQFDVVRINAEFADQTSDHDPLVASFDFSNTFTLQLLHFYGESGTLGDETAPIMGAMVDKFRSEEANTLVLAEGDTWIPGPWLVAGADPSLNAVPGIGSTALARPDVAILNALGTDVSALGNHEFDLGSSVVSGAIGASGAWVGAQFPFITANLNFSADSALRGLADASLGGNAANNFAGKEADAIKGKIAPSAVVTIDGEKIGIVGATTFDLLQKTSPNGTVPKDDGNPATSDLQGVAAFVQAAVDALKAQGVNKIIMVDQLDSLDRNKALAPLLSGVDVMVAGGGHERMGDATDTPVAFNGHDADFVESYPLLVQDAGGNPTLIVTTDTEFTYLGRLVVEFDANGVLNVAALDPSINGAYASSEATLQAVYGTTQSAEEIIDSSVTASKIQAITDAIDAVVTTKDGNKFGFSDVYLEGDRVFGRAQEVNLGNITADANAWKAREALGDDSVVVSLKNGGGLRASIGSIDADGGKIANPIVAGAAGNISQLDVENALRFDNKLMVFDTTPAGLLAILNHGAGLAPGNGGFPQIGGVRFSYDPDLPAGSRISDIALIDENDQVVALVVDNGVVVSGAPAKISVIALNFTANGGDGYPIKANAENFRYLLNDGTLSAPISEALDFTAPANVPANALGEQQAFEEFLEEFHGTPETAYDEADTPAALDTRIQNLNLREDTVFDSAPVSGDDLDNLLPGSAGNDVIDAGVGSDTVDGMGGNDNILGGDDEDLLAGGEGADTIHGGHENDTITGGNGHDQLFGDEGGDSIAGGEGNDTITGGKGNDVIDAGGGDDLILALLEPGKGDGKDTYSGGTGIDTLDFTGSTEAVNITLSGGSATFGSDTIRFMENLTGGDIGDRLIGDSGANVLRGGLGHDSLGGGSGNDTVFGGEGADSIDGGANNDVIVGGAGADQLTGGSGSDQFVFNAFDGTKDTIKDLAVTGSSQDTIVLSFDLFQGFTGDDPFDLIGSGFLRMQSLGANQSAMQIDANGGGNDWQTLAEFNIAVSNGVLADHVVLTHDPIV